MCPESAVTTQHFLLAGRCSSTRKDLLVARDETTKQTLLSRKSFFLFIGSQKSRLAAQCRQTSDTCDDQDIVVKMLSLNRDEPPL
jgi:HEAT repeat protein